MCGNVSVCSSTCVVVSGVGTQIDIVTSCEHWYGSAVCVCVGYHNCVSLCGQHCVYISSALYFVMPTILLYNNNEIIANMNLFFVF